MEKILRINMTELKVSEETVKEDYKFLGGRSLTDQIIVDEVDPKCHPLGPNNKFVIGVGMLTGTTAPCSGRLSAGAKSPLTGGIKESNAGGPGGIMLARMGIKAVVIEGKPEDDTFYIVRITPAGTEILEAPAEIIGKGTYDTAGILRDKYPKSNIMAIGQAGEERCAAACISVTNTEGDPSRNFGRGGLGAILGSKKVKAIVINNEGKKDAFLPIARPDEFKPVAKELAKIANQAGKGLRAYGTAALVTPVNKVGGLPTKNWRVGQDENFEKITGQAIHAMAEENGGKWGHACHPGCVIQCSNIVNDKEGNYITGSLEFETVALFGTNCLVYDLEAIAWCDKMCDDFGVDTIDTGCVAGAAMDAGLVEWGDAEGLKNFVAEIGKKTPLGLLIASGVETFCKVYGQSRVPATKGQSIAAYDPRACKGTGTTYATSQMGGDHTFGNALPGRGKDVNPNLPDHQVGVVRMLQILSASIIDSTGTCLFVGPSVTKLPYITKLVNARYGIDMTEEDMLEFGKKVLTQEKEFNRAAGLPDVDMPEWFKIEKLAPFDLVFDVPEEDLANVQNFDVEMDETRVW